MSTAECPYCFDPLADGLPTCGAEVCEECRAQDLHATETEGRKPTAFEAWLDQTLVQRFGRADSEAGVPSGLAALYEADESEGAV